MTIKIRFDRTPHKLRVFYADDKQHSAFKAQNPMFEVGFGLAKLTAGQRKARLDYVEKALCLAISNGMQLNEHTLEIESPTHE